MPRNLLVIILLTQDLCLESYKVFILWKGGEESNSSLLND